MANPLPRMWLIVDMSTMESLISGGHKVNCLPSGLDDQIKWFSEI